MGCGVVSHLGLVCGVIRGSLGSRVGGSLGGSPLILRAVEGKRQDLSAKLFSRRDAIALYDEGSGWTRGQEVKHLKMF